MSLLPFSSDLSNSRGQYRSYTIRQKMRAVELSKSNGVRSTAAALGMPKSTLLDWTKKLHMAKGSGGQKGRPLVYSREVDFQICTWVLRRREQRIPVSKLALREYAKKIVQVPGFTASAGWATGFMRRHNLVLRTRTSMAQMLPKDLEEKIHAFHTNIQELRSECEFELTVNMDETPVFFDIVPGRTIHSKGERSVICRTTGSEKTRATATLAVSANGDVLSPMVILKGKRFPADLTVQNSMEVVMQEKSWMTEDLMLHWIDNVLVPYTKGRPTLLVMDSFSAHTTDRVFFALTRSNINPTVIPGGCTSKVQSLDVSINKPFKDRLREQWVSYMSEKADQDAIPKPSRQTVLSWIAEAWTSIAAKPDVIQNAFRTCGISAALEAGANAVTLEETLQSDDSDFEFEGFTDVDMLSPRGPDPFV